jgi:hypothetical protein
VGQRRNNSALESAQHSAFSGRSPSAERARRHD